MKVMALAADEGGCGFYRITAPGRALEAAGFDIDVRPFAEHPQARMLGNEIVDYPIPEVDVVVMQRPLQRVAQEAIRRFQAAGIRVVVDIDDDFHAISPRNISFKPTHPRWSPERNRDHLMRACEMADLVTTSTPALARRYGAHGRVAVLANLIPAWYLTVEREPHEGTYVGWTGSLETHPDDLQVCGGGVAQAIRETGATFSVVGTGRGVQRALGLDEAPTACGWVALEEYPHRVAQLDVGIVPLELTPFNEAKSWLKGLEMAALGVPVVASPTAEYSSLRWLFACELAERPKEWRAKVRQLVDDEGWRQARAAMGRAVAATMTYEANAERWWDAWARALDREMVSA